VVVAEESGDGSGGGDAVVPWEAIATVLGEEAAVEELSQAAVSGRHGTVDGQGLGMRGEKKMTLSKKWEGRRKGIEWFLNRLMFIGFHITDEPKRVEPCVPYPLMFIGDMLTNEHKGQCLGLVYVRRLPL
jgi:hypothetical protein